MLRFYRKHWIVIVACVSLSLANSVRADCRPERLLAEDTVAYWRFDGWEPHQPAFDKTAFAEVMHGDLGTFLDYLRGRAMQEIAGGALAIRSWRTSRRKNFSSCKMPPSNCPSCGRHFASTAFW